MPVEERREEPVDGVPGWWRDQHAVAAHSAYRAGHEQHPDRTSHQFRAVKGANPGTATPPCGVQPFRGFVTYAAPLTVLFQAEAAAAFAALKASLDIVLWSPAGDACVGGVLAGLATLYAFFTVYAVRRRGATIRPFSLVWATMTFPSAITCVVWLQYASNVYLLWAARAVAVLDLVFIFAVVVGCGRLAFDELLKRRAASSELPLSRVV